MSSLLQRRTPAQLLWIVAASNALIAIGFGTLLLPGMRHRGLHPALWYPFAAVVLGLIAALIAEQALQNGIDSGRWPDSLLAVPRKLVTHPMSTVLVGFLSIGAIAYVASRDFGGPWVFLWPLTSLIRVKRYFHPKPKSDTLLLSLERPKPLQSESWGAPPRPFTN